MKGASLAFVIALLGCPAEDVAQPAPILVASGLDVQWKLLPHRIARLELAAEPPEGPASEGWRLVALAEGGSFGAFDRALSRVDFRAVAASGLRATYHSHRIEIPAGDASASESASHPAPDGAVVAPVLLGVALSSDEYESPPGWIASYDPAKGFTSAGVGVRLETPQLEGEELTLQITVISRLAPCDRADASTGDDMNGAIPRASTWVTVSYSLLHLPAGSSIVEGTASYFISYPTFRQDGSHMEEAAVTARQIELRGEPGLPGALLALQGFDFLSNDPQQKDPTCTIQAAPECKGAGRYVRTVSAAAELLAYDPASGLARADVKLRFDNDAPDGFKQFEAGNICARAEGHVALIQLPEALVGPRRSARTPEVPSGQRYEQPIDLCEGLGGAAACAP